jgi:hypothetical protein
MKITIAHFAPLALACLALAACTKTSTTTTTTVPEQPATTTQTQKPEVAGGRAAGQYCFQGKDSNKLTEGSLTIDGSGGVQGNLRSSVVDPASGAEAIGNTGFTGTLLGDTLHLQVNSDRTGARTATAEQWIWKGDSLSTGHEALRATPCTWR